MKKPNKLSEAQLEVLCQCYEYLINLDDEEEAAANGDTRQDEPEATATEQQNNDSVTTDSKLQSLQSQPPQIPPLTEQAKKRIEQAESSGNLDEAEKHKAILQEVGHVQ